MATRTLYIEVDDESREQSPDKPWTAYWTDDGAVLACEAGLGATVREAIADLLANDMSDLDIPDGEA